MMKPEHSYKKRVTVGSAAGNGLSRGTVIKQMEATFVGVWKYSAPKDIELGIFAKSNCSPAFPGF